MATTTTPAATEVERVRALVRDLPDLSGSSRDALLAYRRERLRELVRHAVTSSPYYREVLDPDGDLEDLPTLPKATLMAEFDRIVTEPALRLDELEEHVSRAEAGTLFLDRYHVFTTSGTTGIRGLFVYERDEFRVWIAACLRALSRRGVTPDTRLAAIGAPGAVHITRQLFAAFMAGRKGAPRVTVTTPVEETVAALNEYRPEAIMTYAGIGSLLAEEQLQGRLEIEPRIVVVGSEVLTDDAVRRMEDAWGIAPFDVYATTESPFMAVSSSGERGLDVNEEFVILEAVDENNRPVPPGAPSYKVLLTNLVNRAQPLIRYELSDSVTMAEGGDPYLRIARIDGRSDDVLTLRGRAGGEVAVHPHRLRAPFSLLADVVQYQVVYERRGMRVHVVLRDTAPPDTLAAVREALVRALEEAGTVPPPIEVEPVDEIAREPGDGAKLKLVVSA